MAATVLVVPRTLGGTLILNISTPPATTSVTAVGRDGKVTATGRDGQITGKGR
jgi:hypothetical protein